MHLHSLNLIKQTVAVLNGWHKCIHFASISTLGLNLWLGSAVMLKVANGDISYYLKNCC